MGQPGPTLAGLMALLWLVVLDSERAWTTRECCSVGVLMLCVLPMVSVML